ncbi:hypothetical protein LLG96_14215 [bacterium]|nr:hypothetical protein [bacterium]
MARTESKSIQVHPRDEQQQIDFMQHFYWNLLSSQEIKNIDNRLERRGDTIYQVRNTEHYVKLVFSRDLDTPDLDKIKKLENEFFSLKQPKFPSKYPGGLGLWAILLIFAFPISVPAYYYYYYAKYKPDTARAERQAKQFEIDRHEILERLKQYEHID